MLFTDMVLACLHHLLVFGLAGLLAAELALTYAAPDKAWLKRIATVDGGYGASAGAVLLVGAGRVMWGVKGADYYLHNPFFWAKMAAFGIVGLLSIGPTIAILGWRRAGVLPDLPAVAGLRRWLWLELAFFAAIPLLAVVMARFSGF